MSPYSVFVLLLSAFLVSSYYGNLRASYGLTGHSMDEPDHQEVVVKPGDDATLPCLGPWAGHELKCGWMRNHSYLIHIVANLNGEHMELKHIYEAAEGRLKLRDLSSMRDGDCSVTLQNVTVNDQGIYECVISWYGEGYRRLRHFIYLTVSRVETKILTKYDGCSEIHLDFSAVLKITVVYSVQGVLLLCIVFLVVRYINPLRDAIIRSFQQSKVLSRSKDIITQFLKPKNLNVTQNDTRLHV